MASASVCGVCDVMAGTRFQVKSYGADLVAKHLLGVAAHAADIRPAQPAVARRVAEGYARSFDRQGPGWHPLSRSTVRSRIREGYPPGPILRKTGAYKSAATNPFRLRIDASRDQFLISVDDPKAGWHQGGTKRMKARPLLMSFGDRAALIKIISDWVISGYGRGV